MRFSIIIPHYQGSIASDIFLRGINSLLTQTLKDFEILCYHDGPLLRPEPSPVPIHCTEARANDFGHSLRNRGINEATGEYILHFNPDNILYPNALELIAKEADRKSVIADSAGNLADTNDMILFAVKMIGLQVFRRHLFTTRDPSLSIIITGNPPILGNIDAMQLVVRREIWIREGGWYDKRPDGDGYMYEKFCAKYGYRTVGAVLGEHW